MTKFKAVLQSSPGLQHLLQQPHADVENEEEDEIEDEEEEDDEEGIAGDSE